MKVGIHEKEVENKERWRRICVVSRKSKVFLCLGRWIGRVRHGRRGAVDCAQKIVCAIRCGCRQFVQQREPRGRRVWQVGVLLGDVWVVMMECACARAANCIGSASARGPRFARFLLVLPELGASASRFFWQSVRRDRDQEGGRKKEAINRADKT